MPPQKKPPVPSPSPPDGLPEDVETGARITLRDIAREMKVTAMTVSLALRDNPRVSKALREDIQQKAREMGYRSDPMLSALSSLRHRKKQRPIQATLAWINSWRPPEKLRQYLEFDLYWQGAVQAAEKLGYRVEEFIVADDVSLKKLEKIFRARNIYGVLLPPQPLGSINWTIVPWDSLHTVRFGYGNYQLPDFHMVTSDQNANAVLAFSEVQRKGYRRIGFVGGKSNRRLFLSGFLQAQIAVPPSERVQPLLYETASPSVIDLVAWCKKERPDAILSDAPEVADLLAQIGLKIPDDVAVATFSTLDGHVNAGIYQNSREIGRIAIFLLHSLILDNARGIPTLPRKVAIPGTWVDGSSLPERA